MIDNGQSGDFGQQIQREILEFFSWNIRNDRGEFRISVPAGKYYLIAHDSMQDRQARRVHFSRCAAGQVRVDRVRRIEHHPRR
jgi:hypothetical protein